MIGCNCSVGDKHEYTHHWGEFTHRMNAHKTSEYNGIVTNSVSPIIAINFPNGTNKRGKKPGQKNCGLSVWQQHFDSMHLATK